jgi:hypothetical protein
MADATITLPAEELAKFSQAMRDVVAVTGASAEEVTRGFAGRILKRWAGKTKVVTEANIIRRARARTAHKLNLSKANQNDASITINNGARGGQVGEVWHRTANNKYQQAGMIVGSGYAFAFVPAWKHWKTAQWSAINHLAGNYARLLGGRIFDGIRSINLGRQSVVQIAKAIGIDLTKVPGQGVSAAGIAKANAAVASNGQVYVNGTGKAHWNANRFFVEMVNNYPKGVNTGMDTVLAGVIANEIKYYERNMAEGVFLAHERVARAYPFLKVAKAA